MTSVYFGIYELFHDRPGTPAELKCIGCSMAASVVSLTLFTAGMIGGSKLIYKKFYPGVTVLGVGLTFGALGLVAARKAYDDTHFNERLMKLRTEEIKEERRQFALGDKNRPSNNIKYM